MKIEDLAPGQRVRIRQKIARREGAWLTDTVGTIEQVQMEPTGSWLAQGRDNKLWLVRIRLKKDDGERTTLSLDQWTEIERVSADAGAASA